MTTEMAARRSTLRCCPHCGSRSYKADADGGSCLMCGCEGPTRAPTREESEGIAEVDRIESTIPGLNSRGGRYWRW